MKFDDWKAETKTRLATSSVYRVLQGKCKNDPVGNQVLELVDNATYYAYQRTKSIIRHVGEFTVVAVCEQENKKDMGFTLEAMRVPIEVLGYQVIGEQAIFRIFDRGKVKEDSESLEKAFILGKDLAKSLNKK